MKENNFKLTEKQKHLLASLTNGMAVYLGRDKRTSSHWEKLQKEGYVRFECDHAHITKKGQEALTRT